MTVSATLLTALPRTIPTDMGPIIAYLVGALVLVVLLCLFRKRFLKIACACGAEICLFLACRLFFGDESIITVIMQWFTAAVACIMTVAIVNRINWSNMRGRPTQGKGTSEPQEEPAPRT